MAQRNAVPGTLNIPVLTGDEQVQVVGGPRDAQSTARQVAASGLSIEDIDVAATTYTFVLADAGGAYKRTLNGSGVTVTVPENDDVPFPVGAQLIIEQGGAGQITLVGAGSVTLNAAVGLKSSAQYAQVSLVQTDTDVWTVGGSTAA